MESIWSDYGVLSWWSHGLMKGGMSYTCQSLLFSRLHSSLLEGALRNALLVVRAVASLGRCQACA